MDVDAAVAVFCSNANDLALVMRELQGLGRQPWQTRSKEFLTACIDQLVDHLQSIAAQLNSPAWDALSRANPEPITPHVIWRPLPDYVVGKQEMSFEIAYLCAGSHVELTFRLGEIAYRSLLQAESGYKETQNWVLLSTDRGPTRYRRLDIAAMFSECGSDGLNDLDLNLLAVLIQQELFRAQELIGAGKPQRQASVPEDQEADYVGPLSPSEWAKKFEVSPTTFARMRRDGTIRFKTITSKRISVHPDDVVTHTKSP